MLREVAHGLAARGWEVEVLTTCARDHHTWANELPPGTTRDGSVTVRRFPVVRDTPGAEPRRDLVLATCQKCHEIQKVAEQHMDKPGWKRLLEDMVNQGASASDEDWETMAVYLSKAFPKK